MHSKVSKVNSLNSIFSPLVFILIINSGLKQTTVQMFTLTFESKAAEYIHPFQVVSTLAYLSNAQFFKEAERY